MKYLCATLSRLYLLTLTPLNRYPPTTQDYSRLRIAEGNQNKYTRL